MSRRSPRMDQISPLRMQDGDAEGGVQLNPMLGDERPSGPSPAFIQSMRNAQKSGSWRDSRMDTSHPGLEERRKPGTKTKLAVALMVLLGVCMFISGGVIYWSGDYGEDEKQTGLDLLAFSSLPLLPGIYGLVNIIGNTYGWHGYTALGFSYD